MNPKLVAKAVRMPVVARSDGSYHVGGDSDTRTVYVRATPPGNRFYCDCPAGRTSTRHCSHILATIFFRQRSPERTSPEHSHSQGVH